MNGQRASSEDEAKTMTSLRASSEDEAKTMTSLGASSEDEAKIMTSLRASSEDEAKMPQTGSFRSCRQVSLHKLSMCIPTLLFILCVQKHSHFACACR